MSCSCQLNPTHIPDIADICAFQSYHDHTTYVDLQFQTHHMLQSHLFIPRIPQARSWLPADISLSLQCDVVISSYHELAFTSSASTRTRLVYLVSMDAQDRRLALVSLEAIIATCSRLLEGQNRQQPTEG